MTKKSRNGRKSVLSAKAKRRQERGLDRAEAVMDKKEKKIEVSKGRARTVQERAKAWDDLNKKIAAKKAREEAMEKENWAEEQEGMEDVEDEAIVDEAMAVEVIAQSTPLPEPVEDEEEIL